MASLGTLGLGTYTNSNRTVIVGAEPVLQVIASADDAKYVYTSDNTSNIATALFQLDAFPGDLGNVDTLSVRLRYHWQTGSQVNTWNSLKARVFKADGTTPLTNQVTVASTITNTTAANSSVIDFTGVDTGASAADWDGAVLHIEWDVTKVKGGDTLEKRVTAGELTGTYTAGSPEDDLTATGITTGAPTLGTPDIGQIHGLTATGIAAGAPTLGAPSIVWTADADHFTADDDTNHTADGWHDDAIAGDHLTASGITTGAPTLGTPTIGQTHALTASGITTAAPDVGSATLGQAHALSADGIATGAPTLGTPTIGQAHALTATGIATGSPTVGSPTMGQVHALTADGVTAGAPVLGAPSMSGEVSLTADGITTGAPTLGTPTVGQEHGLSAAGITAGQPTLGTPAIGQIHALTATGIATAAPVLGTPTLTAVDSVDELAASGITAGAPTLGAPTLAVVGANERGTWYGFNEQYRLKRLREEDDALMEVITTFLKEAA